MYKVAFAGVFILGMVVGWTANTIYSKWTLGNNMYDGMFGKEAL